MSGSMRLLGMLKSNRAMSRSRTRTSWTRYLILFCLSAAFFITVGVLLFRIASFIRGQSETVPVPALDIVNHLRRRDLAASGLMSVTVSNTSVVRCATQVVPFVRAGISSMASSVTSLLLGSKSRKRQILLSVFGGMFGLDHLFV